MSETWLEKQMFSIRDIKKIIFVSTILSNQDLVEECGLSRRHIQSLHDSLVINEIKIIKNIALEKIHRQKNVKRILCFTSI